MYFMFGSKTIIPSRVVWQGLATEKRGGQVWTSQESEIEPADQKPLYFYTANIHRREQPSVAAGTYDSTTRFRAQLNRPSRSSQQPPPLHSNSACSKKAFATEVGRSKLSFLLIYLIISGWRTKHLHPIANPPPFPNPATYKS